MIPLPVIFAIVSAVAGATGAHLYTRNHYETVLAERTATQATALAQANANALAETQRLQAAKDEAERLAKVRQSALARDAAASRDALIGLSHATDSALRSASDSHSACLADASNLAVVFGRCATKLQGVAADADLLANNVQTLIEAWPKE